MVWSETHRGFVVCAFFENGKSVAKTQKAFRQKFNIPSDGLVPQANTIRNWVRQFEATGTPIKNETHGRKVSVTTPENMQRVLAAVLEAPERSCRQHAIALGISDRSVRRILQKFKELDEQAEVISDADIGSDIGENSQNSTDMASNTAEKRPNNSDEDGLVIRPLKFKKHSDISDPKNLVQEQENSNSSSSAEEGAATDNCPTARVNVPDPADYVSTVYAPHPQTENVNAPTPAPVNDIPASDPASLFVAHGIWDGETVAVKKEPLDTEEHVDPNGGVIVNIKTEPNVVPQSIRINIDDIKPEPDLLPHENEMETFTCAFCQLKNFGKEVHQMHEKLHMNFIQYPERHFTKLKYEHLRKDADGIDVYMCDQCEFTASETKDMGKHIFEHVKQAKFKCELCNYKTDAGSSFRSHMKCHAPRNLQCPQCTYKTHTQALLDKHKKRHEQEKKYSCFQCDFKANHQLEFDKHMYTHTGQKRYSCDQCDYQASYRSNLVLHQKSHDGDFRFHCNDCDYKTNDRRYYTAHLSKHTGKKLLTCELCDYETNFKHLMKHHILNHSDSKLYNCTVCDYGSNIKGNFQKHMRDRHPDAPSNSNDI